MFSKPLRHSTDHKQLICYDLLVVYYAIKLECRWPEDNEKFPLSEGQGNPLKSKLNSATLTDVSFKLAAWKLAMSDHTTNNS